MPTEMPGLVLEWRQNPDWEALVTYVEPRGAVVIERVPAERLRPVRPVPETASQRQT